MTTDQPSSPTRFQDLARYPLFQALLGRRSRRFGMGMQIEHGPLAYTSQHPPLPLTEEEEAALAFAACGVTGFALADISYGPGQGGTDLFQLRSRTASGPSVLNAVSVVVTNDEATYLLKRPTDFPAAEIGALAEMARQGQLVELYRRSRIKIADGRAAPPVKPAFNFNLNRWSLYAPGGTYFIPINEMTAIYINSCLELFDPSAGIFLLDERAGFKPAGLAPFARSKGGHLYDNPRDNLVGTIQAAEISLAEAVTVEQGMILQNLSLMAQALGLGGFANFARHEFGWFQALGFRMAEMPASQYLGASHLVSEVLEFLGRDQKIPYALGLEREGEVLLKPYCPPYYPTMEAAVRALVEKKYGPEGAFRGGAGDTAWRDPAAVEAAIPPNSEPAIQATIAHCEYLYHRYGRFPAYSAPFRTVTGYQVTHVDSDFYDRFYKDQALTETQREHMARWHSPMGAVTNS